MHNSAILLLTLICLLACSPEAPRTVAGYERITDCPAPRVQTERYSVPDPNFVDAQKTLFKGTIQCPGEIVSFSGQESTGKIYLRVNRSGQEIVLHEVVLDSVGFGNLRILGLNDEGLYFTVFEGDMIREIFLGTPDPTLYRFDWRAGVITKKGELRSE